MSTFYRYYDSPDGKDFIKKEYYLCRRMYPFGIYTAWFDVVAFNRPTGFIPVAARFFQVFSRPLIVVSLWNVTNFTLTLFRGDDKPSNYALSVIPVAYYATKFYTNTACWCAAVPAMVVLAGIKQYKMNRPNVAFFKEISTYRDDVDNSIYADFLSYFWSGVKEKNWVTIDDAIKQGIVSSNEEARRKRLTNYKDGQARGLIRVGDGSENLEFAI